MRKVFSGEGTFFLWLIQHCIPNGVGLGRRRDSIFQQAEKGSREQRDLETRSKYDTSVTDSEFGDYPGLSDDTGSMAESRPGAVLMSRYQL
jgi:hypothetical protein